MAPKRKYDDGYIKFGFIAIETNREIRPQCVICATVLSNDALKLAKLERHLKSVHPTLSDGPPEFFMGKSENLKKMKLGTSGSRFESNEKVLSASFKISQLIVKSKKPHTIGENVLKPCLLTAVEEILGAEAKKKIQEIPLSNNTVKARIDKMSFDIEEQLLVKIKNSPFFALQCDESTDVSQCCQLLGFVRFLDNDNLIKEELLLLQELGTTSKGTRHYVGKVSRFLYGWCSSYVRITLRPNNVGKKKNCKVLTTYCIIHRQALASKTLPEELLYTLKQAIKLKSDGFRKFEIHLAYLVDIFEHLNKLNLQLQGSGNNKLEGSANIFIFEDKLRAFMCKIDLWISKVEINNYSAFQTLKSLVDNEKYADLVNEVQQNVLHHLKKLKNEFNRYFPEYNDLETKGVQIMFSTTYLCEQGFSGLLYIKNKQRNRLDATKDLRVALSSINPRISLLNIRII
ncbi:hypothetical protein AGLY_011458 [Aphis glycines]|uniref:DUF4371 domain-containing protein n=1 Tax=Aphis glycines TaxID=307491 RepID=A0A6G0TDQ9_APHGL|nr:hypothetical protein AGLY_011458 [Aphis glycines]